MNTYSMSSIVLVVSTIDITCDLKMDNVMDNLMVPTITKYIQLTRLKGIFTLR